MLLSNFIAFNLMEDHSITEVVEIICQVCSQEEHSAIECPWLYSPCTEAKCNGRRITIHSTTLRTRGMPFLKCQYGCSTSWKWLEEAIGLCTWCFNCGDNKHVSKDCPWSIMKCRHDGCDGRRYVWKSQTNGLKFLNCYACNDFQWLTEVKRDAKTTTTKTTIKAEPTITKETVSICQVCAQEEHSALKCPWVTRPCIEQNCNSILMIMVSQNSQNLGRTYLKCQNGFCTDSKQWLDEAIVKGDSVPKGCFKCYDDHLEANCPWSGIKCSHVYCDGTTDVYPVYKKYKTNGWRYLQCLTCNNDFQWLMVAKRQRQKQLEMLKE